MSPRTWTDMITDDTTGGLAARPLSRRRLFEMGGATAALAALLAACGGDDGAPGRVGNAATPTELPDEEVGDVVYLRTLMSLEESILEIYERFAADGELDGAAADALERFIADHTAASEELAGLIEEAGGEPFPCPNPWYGERFFDPTLDRVFGNADAEPESIPASDDIPRDVKSLVYSFESLVSASAFQFVGRLSTAELRATTIAEAAKSARRAATMALLINPGPAGYVSPELLGDATLGGGDAAEATEAPVDGTDGPAAPSLPSTYAISSRFAQLTPINVEVGAPNDLNQRFKTSFETPADNAFAYTYLDCPA